MDIEKIQMMTKLAIFEKKEGKEILEVSRYYKGDYVAAQIFKAVLHYSLCFVLVSLLAALIQLETILLNLNINFLSAAAKLFLLAYFTGLSIMIVLSGFGAASHFDHAKYMGDIYAAKLERILSYEESGDAVRYAREAASSYMKQYYEESQGKKSESHRIFDDKLSVDSEISEGWLDEPDEPDGGWLDDEPDEGIDVMTITHRGREV